MDNCQECRELWNAYRAATSEHLIAAKELMRSVIDNNQNAWKSLSLKEATAFYKMTKLRHSIRQHEIDTHNAVPTESEASAS
jgi:hypothetical protein